MATFCPPRSALVQTQLVKLSVNIGVNNGDASVEMNNEEYTDYEKRFDVAAISIENGIEKINHIENAF